MQPDESVKVAIWLTSTGLNAQPKPDNSEVDEKTHAESLAASRKNIADKERAVINALGARGFKVIYASQYAPLVFAELPKNAILELEKMTGVDMIYISRTYEPEINTAAYTERANASWGIGITGTGINIAVVEGDGINFTNPYLADGLYYNSGSPNTGSHATAVAGIIESTHSTYRGIAYGAPALLSANSQDYSDASIIAATEWALNNGANIISNSWGIDTGLQIGTMDRYMDHIVWTHWKTVVKSAGNRGTAD